MKYGLLFYETEAELGRRESADAPQYWGAWASYIDRLDEEKVLVRGAGAGLHSPSSATTVRLSGVERQIQDGPIANVKEQLGGMVIIDVPDLDTALKYASLAPCAQAEAGGVEIRPILTPPGE